RARIVRAATAFLASRPDLAQRPVRFDLLMVHPRGPLARVRHLAGAFEAPGRPQGSWNRRRTG
ncbi:MAG: hypothetical protein QOK40_2607, partial [Miltoncostaeaceae bacterium]|nr:hypothetical protein [Miltoncostaeaceae bacterium]